MDYNKIPEAKGFLTAKKFEKMFNKFLTKNHNTKLENKLFRRELEIFQRAQFIDRGMLLLLKKEGR